jgi:hypothetical protein
VKGRECKGRGGRERKGDGANGRNGEGAFAGRDELPLIRVLYSSGTLLLDRLRGNAATTLPDEQELIPTAIR